MAGIDFQAILDSMSAGNMSNDPIRSIYEILPIYDNDQQHLLFQAFYFIEKYDLSDMRSMFESFDKVMAHNKNLGLLSSKVLQNLLSAYTQNEYLRGIKVSTLNNVAAVVPSLFLGNPVFFSGRRCTACRAGQGICPVGIGPIRGEGTRGPGRSQESILLLRS